MERTGRFPDTATENGEEPINRLEALVPEGEDRRAYVVYTYKGYTTVNEGHVVDSKMERDRVEEVVIKRLLLGGDREGFELIIRAEEHAEEFGVVTIKVDENGAVKGEYSAADDEVTHPIANAAYLLGKYLLCVEQAVPNNTMKIDPRFI